MTQNDMILDYMKTHKGGISPKEANDNFGCMRLSARISDLRKMGYDISTTNETRKNRYGHSTTYARYKLEG